jgi:hypothetical protein
MPIRWAAGEREMRKIGLTIAVAAVTVAGPAIARDPLLHHFEGTWGVPGSIGSCEENAATIGFSKDGSKMTISYTQPMPGPDEIPATVFNYQVLGVAGNSVRMALDGEIRTTPNGDLVAWDLMRLSGEAYCWHRADWEPGMCTPPRLRCESILDDFERMMRQRTSDALGMMERFEFETAASMFGLPIAIPESERANEYQRLTSSLAVIVREFGTPIRWSEAMQRQDEPPEIVNLSIGPSHVVVSQEHGNFFFAFFQVDFAIEGEGFFRAAFDSTGKMVQMTFSLPRERTERLAEIGEILLRETAHEL